MSSLAAQRPRFREDEAVALARDLYGLAATARPLPSERDQNFRLTAASGDSFVLKISRADERADDIDLQNRALEWLAARDGSSPLPRVRPTRLGASVTVVAGPDGATHIVRLLTYLPGVVMAGVRPRSPALLRSLGRLVGGMDRALQGFSHPAAVDRDLDWDPARAATVIRRHQGEIRPAALRALIDHFLARFETAVAPVLPSLGRSVIHNDANDHNVLVNEPTARERRVVGLVDFGDMLEGPRVCDLAVTIAYAMFGHPNPVAAAAQVVSGYHEALPLTEAELDVLFTLACARLCTSVALSAHRRSIEPENAYLTVSEAPAWAALERLAGTHPRLAHYAFRRACGLPPCPESPRVVEWLRSNRTGIGPVIDPGLARKPIVFDWSVGSLELASVAEARDTAALTERVFRRMKEAGAGVGVGRYDEARLAYASDLFKGPAGEYEEWRTIHLGIDLFLPPGSPVFAPLDGRVHSFRNNEGRLDYGPTILLQHEVDGAPRFFTLYGHLTEDSLRGLQNGTPVPRGAPFARVGAPPSNGDWPPHLHFQIVTDVLDRDGEFPGVAAASEREIWLGLSPDPNLILALPDSLSRGGGMSREQILEGRRGRIGPSLSLSYGTPLEIVRGSGQYLYDETGRAFLDVVNNVCHVGHCHPRVVEAGQRQMATLNTNTRYLHEAIVRYAERLCATLPEPLRACFFVNSGSEANELALRLARAHSKGRDLIVVDGAYHGNTTSLVEISPYKFDGPGGEGAPPHVHKVPMPDDYRGPHRRPDPATGEQYAAYVGEAARGVIASGRGLAGFICESLLSCGGQIELPRGYLPAAYLHVRQAGGVCIADEVQVGFGRVGRRFWGFELQDVVPDIVTMGKPIGNGHPLGAVITTPEIAASFANGMEFFSTFGGNPVSCAIGLAVLDVIQDERLQERALRVGERLRARLRGLMDRHPILGDVRGSGLFLGIELVLDRETLEPAAPQAAYVVERMKDRGILLSTDGPLHNVVKMKPPLVFSEADADRLVAALDEVLAEDFVRAGVSGAE